MKTGFVYSTEYLKHSTEVNHPECAGRLEAILERLTKTGTLTKLEEITPEPVKEEWIATIHDKDYIESVKKYCESGIRLVDFDTQISKESFDVAKLAVGGVLKAIDKVQAGEIQNAFCAVRPPGHHAEADRIMGFCLFNNVAIGAKYLQQKYGLKKIAIIDFDVHHGNGTQNSFYNDETVLFISSHQIPLYPGSGMEFERGAGKGEGSTLNIPLKPESEDIHILEKYFNQVIPKLEDFKPEFILISAGFDAHVLDPLSNLRISTECFGKITQMLKSVAEKCCGGKIVATLEGGYNLKALGESVESHIKVLANL